MTRKATFITIWIRYFVDKMDESKSYWGHNHIENGINTNEKPTPNSKEQLVWNEAKWRKRYGKLINHKVVYND